MKRYISILMVMFSVNGFAQEKSVETYCEVLATGKFLSNKVTITVDFGQEQSIWESRQKLKDDTGKVKDFNSVVDALNYMGQLGWKFVDAFPITITSGLQGTVNVYHYYFKKDISLSEYNPE